MIFFDMKKVFSHSAGKNENVLDIIRYLIYKDVPRTTYDPIYKYSLIDFFGHSFIINPEPLIDKRIIYSNAHKVEYIYLASLRSYSRYKLEDITTLEVFHTNRAIKQLKQNKLLDIKDNNIIFIYEH